MGFLSLKDRKDGLSIGYDLCDTSKNRVTLHNTTTKAISYWIRWYDDDIQKFENGYNYSSL